MTRSALAEDIRRDDEAAVRAMSPLARLEMAFELGQRGVEMYALAHGLDPAIAARQLKRAGRAGRRYSRCMDDDAL